MHREVQGGPPRYAQLAAMIRAGIIAGRLRPGDRIPSEPELVDEHHVSKTTASRALDLLAAEGLIVRHSGRGSFVADAAALPAPVNVHAPAGTRVTARWPGPGELAGAPPGTIALVIELPGETEALYPADRASVVFG